jgi:predicted dienelactone hydrolase
VRTLRVTDRNRADILATKSEGPIARSDRELTLEIWYPAALAPGQRPGGEYQVMTRDPKVLTTLHGRAVRDGQPATDGAPFPLVILSHGYPGNRFLLAHLGENLASKGYVVVAIDHRDSTYDDVKDFASTLYNRPHDQLFVLHEMARLGKGSASFLAGVVDADHTGIVGYSMGGYGAINVIGGGFSTRRVSSATPPLGRLLAERGAANPTYRKSIDRRIAACVAVAPWGMADGYWDAEGLRGIETPVLFVAGSRDTIAGYEKGIRALFQATVNSDRHLLTFINASHNAAAPIPAPPETLLATGSSRPPFLHYARSGVGHPAHEQHPRPLRDGLFRLAAEGRRERIGLLRSADARGGRALEGFPARNGSRPDHRARRGRSASRALTLTALQARFQAAGNPGFAGAGIRLDRIASGSHLAGQIGSPDRL